MRVLLLLLLCSSGVWGQPQSGVPPGPDTSRARGVVLLDPGIALGEPTLLIPQSLETDLTIAPLPFYFVEPLPAAPPFLDWTKFEPKADLMSPLRLQWERERQLRPLYTLLGTVQLGGVAYIAYRHLKKYGFRR